MCKRPIYVVLLVLGLAAGSGQAALVHHWELDDAGTTAVDSAGGLDGVIRGGPASVPGPVGQALSFDGTDDVVEIANFTPPPQGTVAFWLNSLLTGTVRRVLGTGGNYEIWINESGDVANELYDNGSNTTHANGVLRADEWVHIAATYDSATTAVEIYVNGALNIAGQADVPSTPGGRTLLLGHRSGASNAQRLAGMLDDVQIYDEVLTAERVKLVYDFSATIHEMAADPVPADGQTDVPRDAILGWTPGMSARMHDVYFGARLADVTNAGRNNPLGVLLRQGQDANTYAVPIRLDFGQTYFWRIDEVLAPPASTIFQGQVWSFTTEPYASEIENVTATSNGVSEAGEGPENTVNRSGLSATGEHSTQKTDMWLAAAAEGPPWIQFAFDRVYKLHELLVWNYNGDFEKFLGFGLQKVNIEHSADGAVWMALGETTLDQATASATYTSNTTVPLDGVAAKYVRLTVVSAYGAAGQYGLSEVQFTYVPTHAREPQPASEATDVAVDAILSWRAGREAALHEVYLSTDRQAVIAGTAPAAKVTTAGYDPSLEIDKTYYWKVNEVNEAAAPSVWEGSVWSFSTPPYVVVEDFEAYTDDEGSRIYETWIDGFGTTTNGSQVGYTEAPFAEQTIVHGDRQSMPVFYDNTATAMSEAVRTFDAAQGWAGWGAKTLVVFFYGDPGNTGGQLYVKVNNQKVVYPGAGALSKPLWQQWNIDLASLGATPQNVTKLTIGVDGAGAQGTVYMDDIRLYASAPAAPEQIWIEAENATTMTVPLEVASNLPDASGGKYMGSVDAGLSRSTGPGDDGTGLATYTFAVQGGTYAIRVREIVPSGQADSWWIRIQGATLNRKTHASGWIQWNNQTVNQNWAWNYIYSSDDGGRTVLFTLPAGTHTLEIAYREDGGLLDAFVIEAQ